MAEGMKKVDERELVRAHVYSILGEPEDGVLATRKDNISYSSINAYTGKFQATASLHEMYSKIENEAEKERFERSVYNVLYMYGLGTEGYSRLAKLLQNSENAEGFMANADKIVALAERKSGILVSYPEYSEPKIKSAEVPVKMEQPPAAKAVESASVPAIKAEASKAKVQEEIPPTVSAEKVSAERETVSQKERIAWINCTKDFVGSGKFPWLQGIAIRPSEGGNLKIEPAKSFLISGADGGVQITRDTDEGKEIYYLTYYKNPNNRNEYFVKLINYSENQKTTTDTRVYVLERDRDGTFHMRENLESKHGARAPIDISLNAGEGKNISTHEIIDGKVNEPIMPVALDFKQLEKVLFSSSKLQGLEVSKPDSDRVLKSKRYEITGKMPDGTDVTYRVDLYRKDESNQYTLRIVRDYDDAQKDPASKKYVSPSNRDGVWYTVNAKDGTVIEGSRRGGTIPLNITIGTKTKDMAYTYKIDEKQGKLEATSVALETRRQQQKQTM